MIRVVVPDLRRIAEDYLAALRGVEGGDRAASPARDAAVDELFDQMVRRTPSGTGVQRPWVARLERAVRGTARDTGELHRWMYDRVSLRQLLESVGFTQAIERTHRTSALADWHAFHLDTEPDGRPYKPGSLYMEAVNPG